MRGIWSPKFTLNRNTINYIYIHMYRTNLAFIINGIIQRHTEFDRVTCLQPYLPTPYLKIRITFRHNKFVYYKNFQQWTCYL